MLTIKRKESNQSSFNQWRCAVAMDGTQQCFGAIFLWLTLKLRIALNYWTIQGLFVLLCAAHPSTGKGAQATEGNLAKDYRGGL